MSDTRPDGFPADEELIADARSALERAYAPYSGFRVGAAIVDEHGRTWTGANIEISASGVSLCAERVALAKAVSDGARRLVRLVLVAEDPEPVTPCGVCRQTLQEFGDHLTVLMAGQDGRTIDVDMAELIPFPYDRGRRPPAS